MTATASVVNGSSTERFFASNSRSFSFASLGFKPAERRLVQCVYAFCRITDDIVDEAGDAAPDEILRRLDEWRATASDAYHGRLSGIDWLDELMQKSAARGVPFSTVETLIDGVGVDATLTRVETVQEFRSYCYGVASIVGIWLCRLLGVDDDWRLERAEALGRAMQTTNILRDVGEDFRRGRVYLPASLMTKHGVSYEDLGRSVESGIVPDGYPLLVDEIIAQAEADYRLGWEAIPTLPGSFARASAVAADVYREIHRIVVRSGYNNFTQRAVTSSARKVVLMVGSLLRLYRYRIFR